MSNRLNISEVKKIIESRGYFLETLEYLNYKTKICIACPKGHKWAVSMNNFMRGQNCPLCLNKTMHDIESVKKMFTESGYFLETTEYKNMHQKLASICPNGHAYGISLDGFMRGSRCQFCKGVKKYSYLEVQKIFEKEGYALLSQEYSNSNKKLKVVCPNKHSYEVSVTSFIKNGTRCQSCKGRNMYSLQMVKDLFENKGYKVMTQNYENMHQKIETVCPNNHTYITTLNEYTKNYLGCLSCRGVKKLRIDEVRDILKKEGYSLLSKAYLNKKQKLEIVCPNGHNTSTSMTSFIRQKSRCRFCVINPPHNINSVRSILEKEGYTLISTEYVGAHSKLLTVCPKNHEYFVSFSNFKNCKSRCTKCSIHGTSKPEQEISSWIKQFYENANKKVIFYDQNNGKKRLELDVYIPELKLGIEYNGLIWHSEKYKENNFHFNKMKLTNSLGIRLINIFGDEWENRKDQIKNYLLSVIGKNSINIGARKTEVRVVDKKEATIFLEENHIQGGATIGIAFGLYFNNELVAIITGNKHHRQGQEEIYVLNRLAFKSNVSVQGGSSKLLKALTSYAKEQGYKKFISWSDNRWSEGRVYEKMGFILEENLPVDYSYVKRNERISKQSCQKKNLLKKGAIGNTEKEMALSLGYYRIYDCGKKRWVMDL